MPVAAAWRCDSQSGQSEVIAHVTLHGSVSSEPQQLLGNQEEVERPPAAPGTLPPSGGATSAGLKCQVWRDRGAWHLFKCAHRLLLAKL